MVFKVMEMGLKENNRGPRLQGSKFGKEIVHNHRAALSSITNFKREASVNGGLGDQNCSILGHSSITRRFAAEMVQQRPKESEEVTVTTLVPNPSGVRECGQGTKKLSSSTVNPCGLVDCEIIDVEDSEDGDSDAVSMHLKLTRAMLYEIDRMEEDEESEYPSKDIETSWMKSLLSVVEFIGDIYAHYMKTENQSCVPPSYMAQQPDINEKMRAFLIVWLIEVHYKFEVMDETLILTINLLDRFLESKVVVRKNLQLVGVTALLLASRYAEVSVPIEEDFVLISDKVYTRQDVLDMKKSMIIRLQFKFSVPTPYVFMMRFLKAALSDKKHELLPFFLVELCLVEYEMLKFPPTLLAAAAIYSGQCNVSRFKQWSINWHTDYSLDEVQMLEDDNYFACKLRMKLVE